MDTNVKNIGGNISPDMIAATVYHNGYALLNCLQWLQGNPSLLSQIGVGSYNVQDLQTLYTQLNSFVGSFPSAITQKKVS